jgi:hypothetical protein
VKPNAKNSDGPRLYGARCSCGRDGLVTRRISTGGADRHKWLRCRECSRVLLGSFVPSTDYTAREFDDDRARRAVESATRAADAPTVIPTGDSRSGTGRRTRAHPVEPDRLPLRAGGSTSTDPSDGERSMSDDVSEVGGS